MTRVLIIEDEKVFATLLKQSLEKEGFSIEWAANLNDGQARAESGDFDVVITDLYLPEGTAMNLTDRLHETNPQLPVIVMTAKHTTGTAITATRSGAYDYFAKPDVFDFDNRTHQSWVWVSELSKMIRTAAESAAESKRLAAKVKLPHDTTTSVTDRAERMIGRSRVMQDVFKAIGRAAASDITVLIRGETGTGKELAARAVYSHSPRASQPFIIVNCAAIPENLLESELFGHEAGAFTGANARRIGRFEQANKGTIFLDEIGDMSLPLQQKLLRVLQEQTIERLGGKDTISVDVRVIAATHRELELAIRENEFRQDLYFRLNVAVIHLPALRDRPDDIPELARYFLRRYGAELGSDNPIITQEAEQLLQQQPWPGNVRHLRNVVRKAILLARGYAIGAEVINEVLSQSVPPRPAADQTYAEYVTELLARANSGELENVRETLTEVAHRELYSQAIQRALGDQSKAARWLGVSRPTMLEKLTRFGLRPVSG